MNLLYLLLVVFLILAVVGNPHVLGGYSGYGLGYYPSGLGLIVVIVLLVMLLR